MTQQLEWPKSFRKEVLGWGPGDGREGGGQGKGAAVGRLAREGKLDTRVTRGGLLLRQKSYLVTYSTGDKDTHTHTHTHPFLCLTGKGGCSATGDV